MKKNFILIALLSTLIFASCDNTFTTNKWPYRIQNDSSLTVTVNLSSGASYTLNSGEYIDITKLTSDTVSLADNPRAALEYKVNKSTELNYIYITNMTSYTCKVINTSNYNIMLYENNHMLGSDYSTNYYYIPAKGDKDISTADYTPVTLTLYTNNPSWSAVFQKEEDNKKTGYKGYDNIENENAFTYLIITAIKEKK